MHGQQSSLERSVAKVMLQAGPLPRYEKLDLMPIAGVWREGRSGKRLVDRDPYSGAPLVELSLASAEDVDDAYRGARDAQVRWAATPPHVRRDVLECAAQIIARRREEIVDWLIKEAGSTRAKADIELQMLEFGTVEAASYPAHVEGKIIPAAVPGKESRVYREPVGVIGVISPWNFPLHVANRTVAPALALGNAVVLKPSSETPVTGGLLLAKIFEEAGLPPGVLSVVVGAGGDIGGAFIDHPIPRVLSFTGSTQVGRIVGERAGRAIKKLCLELGGNTPFVVLADADLERAVDAAVVGKFLHQGQSCMAINRIIVEARVHDEFLARFAKRVAALSFGDPSSATTVVGPLINASQFEALDRKVKTSLSAGARAVIRGPNRGLVYAPTVLADVTNDMPAAREELFGPVASVLLAADEEDAIRIANDTEYGLSASVFTRDTERGVQVARRIHAGMTQVNDMPVDDEPNTAFGGVKASGLGRFGGQWAIEALSTDHWISVQHAPRPYPF